jgi:tryptophan synthase alpha chain
MPKKLGETLRSTRALIAYLTVGDPLTWKEEVIKVLASSGVDALEFGIPTSTAKYDGPTIRASYRRALRSGVDEKRALSLIKNVKGLKDSILFTYYDVALACGLENLMGSAVEADVECVLFPDLLIDYLESLEDYVKLCGKYNLEHAFFITSCFPHRLIAKLARLEPSFIYLGLMASSGILLPIAINRNISVVRGLVGETPLLVGFALNSPRQVSICVSSGADGVVVGSAILKLIEGGAHGIEKLKSFIAGLKEALLEGHDG